MGPVRRLWVPASTFALAVLLSMLSGSRAPLIARQSNGPTGGGGCRHQGFETPGLSFVLKQADGALISALPPAQADFRLVDNVFPPHARGALVIAKGKDGSMALRASAKDNPDGHFQDTKISLESNAGTVGHELVQGSPADCCHDGRYDVLVDSFGHATITGPMEPFSRGDARLGNIVQGPVVAEALAVYDQNCNGILDHHRRRQRLYLDVTVMRLGRSEKAAGSSVGFMEDQVFLKDDNMIIEFPENRVKLNDVNLDADAGWGKMVQFDRFPHNEGRKFRETESTRFSVTNGNVRAYVARHPKHGTVMPDATAELCMAVLEDGISSVDTTESLIRNLKK